VAFWLASRESWFAGAMVRVSFQSPLLQRSVSVNIEEADVEPVN
jgi:hypothetical protein